MFCGAVSCEKKQETAEPVFFHTWESLGDLPGKTASAPVLHRPPQDAVPWAGTVSHHILADRLIDAWFRELAARRTVSVFFILSPSHWGLSTERFSLTAGSWRTGSGDVRSNGTIVRDVSRKLDVSGDDRVFAYEHGVSTLMPYIARYFPEAEAVCIAYTGDAPLNQPMAEKLTAALSPYFSEKSKDDFFLLISTDFSHHGGRETTAANDAKTEHFFAEPSARSWYAVVCDNVPGIYVLARLLPPRTRSCILYHTDSYRLSGEQEDDITSYFFSYFWE
ncbi:AmmeMemoRadiSam system protein B [Breznakiella homolactica]|uniref:AmmeMemoRadiSam system protein B n=1 Tax=Breznakiella homolactica TaxID=2798577 RepID=A0A7T8BCP0_9SPIR|nr:AmmeMemoRadiSam system protein B [Breznakiella homolactica]